MEKYGPILIKGVIFYILKSHYTSSSKEATAIQIIHEDGTSHCTLSVYLYDGFPYSDFLPAGHFYVNHWSGAGDMLEELVKLDILVADQEAPVAVAGYVNEVHAYFLNPEWIQHVKEQNQTISSVGTSRLLCEDLQI